MSTKHLVDTILARAQRGFKMPRPDAYYAVVIEQADGNLSAYVPDLPGCVATGATIAEVENEIREAIIFHLEGMAEDGISIPQPTSRVEYIELAA